MGIAICICLSIVFAACAWVFLTWKELKIGRGVSRIKRAVLNNKKATVFVAISTFVLAGLAVELNLIYKSNTIVANLKPLTLVIILMTVCVTDFKDHIIPNKVVIIGLVLRAVYAVIELITLNKGYFTILKSDLLSLAVVAALLILGAVIVKNGLAMGDIKILAVMGVFQGFTGFISSLFCSLLISFIVGTVLLVSRKRNRKDAIAFAPALFIGTLISVSLIGM